jgi:dipeptidyl aminopeptidase/acylaminoacyl peptidase
MRITILLLISTLLLSRLLSAQDGKILSKKPVRFSDSVLSQIREFDPDLSKKINDIDFHRITYLSDGLKVTGYVAEPKAKGKYPCIISNRGGNREMDQWDPISVAIFLAPMASWNYVVIASQYRGVDGGEGKEEFGGKDVNDVLNLIQALAQLPKADTARIGMEGASRGGMMTYLSLKNSCRFKAAVVTAGMSDAFETIRSRPAMDSLVFSQLVPGYTVNKEKELQARSAVFWADALCKKTPLLIMHGGADRRVSPTQALELVTKLQEYMHPVRFILYEGADHGLFEFRKESLAETKRHFDTYLRDGKSLPNMSPHGL